MPDLNDFIGGQKILLKDDGVITLEFPHLKQMMDKNYFDTIYHEHFSYLSLYAIRDVFARNGLTVFDVEEIAPQGGSLRIYGRHDADTSKPVSPRVEALLATERADGVDLARLLPALRGAGLPQQARAAAVPDRGEGGGQDGGRATARRPRATRC